VLDQWGGGRRENKKYGTLSVRDRWGRIKSFTRHLRTFEPYPHTYNTTFTMIVFPRVLRTSQQYTYYIHACICTKVETRREYQPTTCVRAIIYIRGRRAHVAPRHESATATETDFVECSSWTLVSSPTRARVICMPRARSIARVPYTNNCAIGAGLMSVYNV